MLKELINAFRRKDILDELTGRVGEMLDAGLWMFEKASDVLMRESDWNEQADPLYQRDQEINRIEREIREKIVTHLTVSATVPGDALPCLMLMNVVKDAERIGDYCKNIFEVGKFYVEPFEHQEFWQPLKGIRDDVAGLFPHAREAFIEDDSSVAKRAIARCRDIGQQSDMIIQQLLKLHDNIHADEAVAYVLLARHYKRVAAHLSNIATSVVSPVPMLDFPKKP